MATDFENLTFIIGEDSSFPYFESHEQINEYYDAVLTQSADDNIINYVSALSRKGRLNSDIERLCKKSNVADLGYIYGDIHSSYNHEFSECWFSFKSITLFKPDIENTIAAISNLLLWSRMNIPELGHIDLLGYYYLDPLEMKGAIEQAIVTKEPTCDERVWYSDDGDGPWCLFSYLSSIQQLMRDALTLNKAVRHIVQV
jgi:hypothetical protein